MAVGVLLRQPCAVHALLCVIATISTWCVGAERLASIVRPRDGQMGDAFGRSISLAANATLLLVGAPRMAQGSNYSQGCAFMFELSGSSGNWQQLHSLSFSPQGAAEDGFGTSVAMSGDGGYAIVGAPSGYFYGTGAAHIFRRHDGQWLPEQRLEAPPKTRPKAWERDVLLRFGVSVGMDASGRYAIVGAPQTHLFGMNMSYGVAYIFSRHNSVWSLQQELVSEGVVMGGSVAISADGRFAAVAGFAVPLEGANGTSPGVVYVYGRSDSLWVMHQLICGFEEGSAHNSHTGIASAHQAVSLSHNGTYILIGAGYEGSDFQGAAYMYAFNGSWVQRQRFTNTRPGRHPFFGKAVAMSHDGTFAAISCDSEMEEENKASGNQGAVYVYKRTGDNFDDNYAFHARLTDGKPRSELYELQFGSAVVVSPNGSMVVVGAPSAYEKGFFRPGSAYAFVEVDAVTQPSQGSTSTCTPAATASAAPVAITAAPTTPLTAIPVLDDNALSSNWDSAGVDPTTAAFACILLVGAAWWRHRRLPLAVLQTQRVPASVAGVAQP